MQWQCKALSDSMDADFRESQPMGYVTGDDLTRLKRLNLFESCMLQINDKNYLTVSDGDLGNLVRKSQWRKERGTFCKCFCFLLYIYFLTFDANTKL